MPCLRVFALSIAALTSLRAEPTSTNTWPGFRGTGDNHTEAKDLPLTWSDTENIAWSTAIPGTGQSSPVVWNGAVYATSVEGLKKEQLHLTAFSLADGAVRWTKTFAASQPWEASDYVSKAAPTPCTDARGVYAFYESGDLVALAHDGSILWQRSIVKDFGPIGGNHGLGTSLVQDADRLYLAIDHDGPSYLLALSKATGETVWRTEHDQRVSWSTPLLAGDRLYLSASGVVEAYAVKDGQRLWSVGDLKGNNVPSPTLAGDLIAIGSTDKGSNVAVNRDGKIVWRAEEATSSFGSPVALGGSVIYVNKAGIAFSVNAQTGASEWSQRLPDSCWATPLVSGTKVYFFTKGGTTVVLDQGPEAAKPVAESRLTVSDRVYGVAALDSTFIVRTGDRLICIRASQSGPAPR